MTNDAPPNNNDSRDPDRDTAPWYRSQDLPQLILLAPFALLFGVHVAGLAMLLRRWTGVPYLLSMIVLYAILTIPFWYLNTTDGILLPSIATGVIMLATVAPIAVHGREEILNGTNFEQSAPAHILLCIAYTLQPAMEAALT